MREPTLNVDEFMAATGLSRRTVYRYVQAGMPHLLYGERTYRFMLSECAAWMDQTARTKRSKRRQTAQTR